MHPFVIGRGYRMLALEDLVAKLAADGAVFMTMEQAAEEAKAKLFAYSRDLLLRLSRHLLQDRPPGLLLVLHERRDLLRRHVAHERAVGGELGS